MTIILSTIAVSIHMIFIFKRELLFEEKSFKVLLVASFLLGLIPILIKYSEIKIRNIELLQMPFLVLLIFFVMSKIYILMYGKNPKDSFWTNDIKLMKDGVFNALFWFLGLVIPVFTLLK